MRIFLLSIVTNITYPEDIDFPFTMSFQVRACEFISTTPNLFAAPQCLGYRNERGKATSSMCLPSFELIVRHLKRVIRNGNDVKSVFVASDGNHTLDELGKALARMKVISYVYHVDIVSLMSQRS